MRVRIKRYSPLIPYSFHNKIADKYYEAVITDTGMYAVDLGIMHKRDSSQTVWAFDPREVEVAL